MYLKPTRSRFIFEYTRVDGKSFYPLNRWVKVVSGLGIKLYIKFVNFVFPFIPKEQP